MYNTKYNSDQFQKSQICIRICQKHFNNMSKYENYFILKMCELFLRFCLVTWGGIKMQFNVILC